MIYLDNNATTRLDPRVLETMMPFLTDNFANAASTHPFGLSAHDAVKTARQQMAELLSCETHELVFTSGATEAINLAIKGVAENYQNRESDRAYRNSTNRTQSRAGCMRPSGETRLRGDVLACSTR